jgi:DNA-binding NarL/FixJ family response regulator
LNIRIVLADDHAVFRVGLRTLLDMEPDMQVVGEAGDGRQLLDLLLKIAPDVVVMDVSMPGLNGMDATRQALAQTPGLRVVALSMHSQHRFVAGMLDAGATGYLLKSGPIAEVVTAVRSVAAGDVYISPSIAGMVVKGYLSTSGDEPPLLALLSSREREVLQLLVEGHTTKTSARRLRLSERTVETHRWQLMDKLGMHSIAELTKYALREGLISLDN